MQIHTMPSNKVDDLLFFVEETTLLLIIRKTPHFLNSSLSIRLIIVIYKTCVDKCASV